MLSGVLAAVFASTITLVFAWPSPLEGPAETLMEWTPEWAASFLLLHLGTVARPAALLGALAFVMLAGGIAGAFPALLPSVRGERLVRPLASSAVFAAMLSLLGGSAASIAVIVLPYLCAFSALEREIPRVPGRRAFLRESGVVLGGAAGLLVLHFLRPFVHAVASQEFFPFRAPGGLPLAGISSLVTPVSDFYVMDKVLEPPDVGSVSWRLAVGGGVRHSLSLDLASLIARSRTHQFVTLECVDNPVGGPLMSTALWSGVLLRDLLREAEAVGDIVRFHAADGYVESASRVLLEDRKALIACGMNGRTLPREHGYPARLVLPGVYGFKSVKWLTRIEVTHGAAPGPWTVHGWSDLPEIHTTTRVDVARRSGDAVLLGGVAFGGSRGIRAVEVRVNGGPWKRATLGPFLGQSTWVQWGMHLRGVAPARVEVRAIDGLGHPQVSRSSGPYPDGATGLSVVTV